MLNHYLYAWSAKIFSMLTLEGAELSMRLHELHDGFLLLSHRSCLQSALAQDMRHYEVIYLAYMIKVARNIKELEGPFIDSLHTALNQTLSRIFHAEDGNTQNTDTWQLQLGLCLLSSFKVHTSVLKVSGRTETYLIYVFSWLYESEYKEFNTLLTPQLLEISKTLSKRLSDYALEESTEEMVNKWLKKGMPS